MSLSKKEGGVMKKLFGKQMSLLTFEDVIIHFEGEQRGLRKK